MNQLVDSFIRMVRNRLKPQSKLRRLATQVDRRLGVESLENRRVLATVTGFSPTNSGFNVELSEQISTANLNLYDVQSQAAGPADVTLRGATVGDVKGSLVAEGTNIRFVATGGVLPADTYTATLRSAANGFTNLATGALLDGEFTGVFPSGDGVPGGDFVTTFTVTSTQDLIVSIPDVARGPGQPVLGPATGSNVALPTGLPIRLSNAAGVTSVTFTLQYNPELMDITSINLGANAPAGSQLESNLLVPGTATISFFTLAPLEAGQLDIANIIATVPEDAPYGQSQVIRFTSLDVNAGALNAKSDDALHVVAYPGDVNGNRRYDAEDARLIARVGVGLDTGFVFSDPINATAATGIPLFPTIDPIILGDVTGIDGISPLDASDVLRRVVGLPTPNIPAIPPLQSPTDVTLSSTNVGSNLPVGTTVGTFTTTDPDAGDTHTYSLVSGTGDTDNASFTISGNALRTAAVLDAAVTPSRSIRVQTTDSTGRSFQKSFVITVTAVNVAPTSIALSNSSVAENASVGSTIGTLSTVDPNVGDTHTYSIVSVDGVATAAPFAISGNSLQLANSLDFETKSSYVVVIRSVDQGGLSVNQTFTINVTNVNEAPTAIALSSTTLINNAAAGTAVGTLSTTDPDASDTHTYALVAGTGDADNGSFAIVGNELRSATSIDFSIQSSYGVRVRSTDAGGLFTEQVFTITREGENAAPTAVTLTPSSVPENAATGTTVGTLSTTDVDATDTHTYSLVAGEGATDNAAFTVSGNQLLTVATFDFETKSSYSIRVRSTDNGGLSHEQVLTISITNVNEAATMISLSSSSVVDGQPIGTAVGAFSNDDPDVDDTFIYSLVSGDGDDDNESFTITGNQLLTAFVADHGIKDSYSIRVNVVDAGGLSTQQTFTITVTESTSNVAPTGLSLSAASLAENAAADTVVGSFTTTDDNSSDSHIYTLVDGDGDADNTSFSIVGNELRAVTPFDFETQPEATIRVRTTDQDGLFFEQAFTITITDVNEAPTALMLDTSAVDENMAAGTSVGSFTTIDPDLDDEHIYSLVNGDGDEDNAAFTIDGNTLKTTSSFDFESQSTYNIRVRSTDSGELSFERTLVITVNDLNEAPFNLALTPTTIVDGTPSDSAVGTFSSEDDDLGDTATYTLVAGDGDVDNASFIIDNNQLLITFDADMAIKDSYSIRVRVTDSGELFTEEIFTINVVELNVAPTEILLTSSSIEENVEIGSVVGLLSSVDANVDDSHSYTLVDGDGDLDNASFTILGNQLQTAAPLDFETQSEYSVRIRSTDEGGLIHEQVFVITVLDVNEPPTTLTLSSTLIPDGSPIDFVVGTFENDDPDADEVPIYELVPGDGDSDNASFEIVDGQLIIKFAADAAVQDTYSIRVSVTTSDLVTIEEMLTLTVTTMD